MNNLKLCILLSLSKICDKSCYGRKLSFHLPVSNIRIYNNIRNPTRWSKYFGKAIRNDCQCSIEKAPLFGGALGFYNPDIPAISALARTNIDCFRAFLTLGNLVLYRLVII